MASTLNQKEEYGCSRLLLCLLLSAVVLFLCTGAGHAEAGVQALNDSGCLNISLSVDPIWKNEGFSAVLYSNSNGLPTSEANTITRTRDGFLWIGSYAGLIRYDGNTFERIGTSAGVANVRCLYADSQDRLWIGTNDMGVFLMTRGEFRKWDHKEGLNALSIRSVAEDGEGIIYFGTASGGIAMIDGDLILTVLEDEQLAGQTVINLRPGIDGLVYGLTDGSDLFTLKDGKVVTFLSHDECRIQDIAQILPDPAHPGNLYVGDTHTHIYYGNLESNFAAMDMTDITPLARIDCLEYIDGQIWFGTSNGIGVLDDTGVHQLENIPLNSNINAIMTDYEGNLWFTSSRQGVMKIVPTLFSDLFERYDLPSVVVNSTCMCGEQLFIGTDSGLIAVENDRRVNSIPLTKAVTASGRDMEAVDLLELLDGARIRSIIRDSKGRIWFSTSRKDGLLRYDQGEVTAFSTEDGCLASSFRIITECEDGSFLAENGGGVIVIRDDAVAARYGTEDGLNTNILTVEEGFNHDFLCGSDGDGIYVITSDGIKHIGMEEGLTSGVVMRIKRSASQNVYWLVTGSSLAYMTPDYQVTTIREFPYLNNYDLYENSKGDVWVLSSAGIYVDTAENLVANGSLNPVFFDISSGMPYMPTANSYSELTQDGDLYIAGKEGVVKVNIEKPFDNISEMMITIPYVDADGKRYYPDETGGFALPANTRKLTVHPYVFSFSLTDPEVSWHLEGFDRAATTVNRSKMGPVDYTSLKIDVYHFVMTVKDHVGHTEQTVSFRIAKGKEMSVGTAGSIVMDAAALFLMGGILIYTSLYRKRGRLEDRLFFSMILSNIALAVVDGISYYLEGSAYPAAKGVMIAGNIIFYTMFTVFPYLYLLYLEVIAGLEIKWIRRTKLLAGIPCLLLIILLLINLKTGWIFSFTQDNLYHSGPLNNLVFVPAAICFLLCLLGLAKVNVRLVLLGTVLIAARIAGGIWFRDISSTAFTYTLFLVCTHIFVMNKPIDEVAQ